MVEWSVLVARNGQHRARRVYDTSAAFWVKRTCEREVSMKLELSERAAEQLRRLVGETGESASEIVERALEVYARAQRREAIKSALNSAPWERADRDEALYEAGLEAVSRALGEVQADD